MRRSEPTQVSGGCRRLDGAYVMTYDAVVMTNLTATVARAQLYSLIDRAAESSEPIRITGPRNSAVLVSEQDWKAIQETLFLLSIPGMRESIRKGLKTPVSKCAESPGW